MFELPKKPKAATTTPTQQAKPEADTNALFESYLAEELSGIEKKKPVETSSTEYTEELKPYDPVSEMLSLIERMNEADKKKSIEKLNKQIEDYKQSEEDKKANRGQQIVSLNTDIKKAKQDQLLDSQKKEGKPMDGMIAAARMNEKIGRDNAMSAAEMGIMENELFEKATKEAQETSILANAWNSVKNAAKSAASGLQATRAELDTKLGGVPAVNLDAIFGLEEGNIIVRSDSDQEKLLNSAIDLQKSAKDPAITSTSQLRSLSTSGGWGDLTKLVLNNIVQAGIQIPATYLTKGFSAAIQANGNTYLQGVQQKAEANGKTPMQVIADGEDEQFIPLVAAGLSAALDNIGAKGVKDAILTNELKALLRTRAAEVFQSTVKEGITEGLQTVVEETAANMSGGDPFTEAVSKIDPQKIKDAVVAGKIGGGGLSTVGATANALLSKKSDTPSGAYVPPAVETEAVDPLAENQEELLKPIITEKEANETISQSASKFHAENPDIVRQAEEGQKKASVQKALLKAQVEEDIQSIIETADEIATQIEDQAKDTTQDPVVGDDTTTAKVPQPAIRTNEEAALDVLSSQIREDRTTSNEHVSDAATETLLAQDTQTTQEVTPPVASRELSPQQELKNKLVGLSNDYNNLNNKIKNGAEGARLRQQILSLTQGTDLAVKQERGKITVLENDKPIQRTSVDTPTSPAQNFRPLDLRANDVQDFIRQGIEAAFENPSIFFGLDLNMSSEDIQGAVTDIEAGRNTQRAQKLMDVLEAGKKDGFFRMSVQKGGQSVTYDIPADEYFALASETKDEPQAIDRLHDIFKNNIFSIDDVLQVATSKNPRDPNRLESTFYDDLSDSELSNFIDLLKQAKDEQERFATEPISSQPANTGDAKTATDTGTVTATQTESQNPKPLSAEQPKSELRVTPQPIQVTPQPVTSKPPVAAKPTGKQGESQFAKSVIDYEFLKPEQLSQDPALYQIGTNKENIQAGLDLLSKVGEQEVYNRISNYVSGSEAFKKGELRQYATAGILLIKGWDNARQKALANNDAVLAGKLAQNIADLLPQLSQAFTDGGQFVQVASLLDMVKSMDQVLYRLADKAVDDHNAKVRDKLSVEDAQTIADIIAQAKAEAVAEMKAAQTAQMPPLTVKNKKEVQKRIFENRKKAKTIVKNMFKGLDNNPCF
jgi:hypothetical protein